MDKITLQYARDFDGVKTGSFDVLVNGDHWEQYETKEAAWTGALQAAGGYTPDDIEAGRIPDNVLFIDATDGVRKALHGKYPQIAAWEVARYAQGRYY